MACFHAGLSGSSDEPFSDPVDRQLARRVRVRELADAVVAHALGELHRLAPIGGASCSLPVLPFSAGAFEQPAPIRATMARAASGRSVCSSLLHPWIVRRVGVHGQGSRDRRLRGAVRSARARCRRSGTARTRRRARTATPWHRRARCRPRPPTREQTCWGWPPSGRLPLLSRTSRPPRGGVAPGTPGNASHCRRRTRPRRPRHRLRLGAGHRARAGSRLATPGISSSKTVVPSGTAPSASPSAPRCSR